MSQADEVKQPNWHLPHGTDRCLLAHVNQNVNQRLSLLCQFKHQGLRWYTNSSLTECQFVHRSHMFFSVCVLGPATARSVCSVSRFSQITIAAYRLLSSNSEFSPCPVFSQPP